ncbi:TPA: XRE family transcriptional regulator, partial [Streptococcus pyogenes]
AICFLAAAREPYITALMFLLFVAKIFVWIKQTQTK